MQKVAPKEKMYELEEVNTSDPTAFWKYINNLGPKKSSPWEVNDEHGNIVIDHDKVLERWKLDFESLLKPPEEVTQEQMDF